ncbi:MAG: ATP-binding protein [Thermoanaerobaculia bacterium]|nr:ATP-binding protein [Thermoanaerobaculia bacterium]
MSERIETTMESSMNSSDHEPTLVVPGSTAPLVEPMRRAAQEQFRQLMDNLEQVYWISDLEPRSVIYVSPAYETIWGRTCQSLYDEPQSFINSIHVEDRERMVGIAFGENSSRGYDEEFRILRPDGEIRWIWGRSYPVKDAVGHVGRFSGIAEDVTERKASERENRRLEAQFIEAQKLDVVGRLACGIAHDFNNFLAVIMSYSELMIQRLEAHDPGRKYAEEIHLAAARAGDLTRQLLVFSRGQLVEPVVLDLNELVGATATMMRRLLGEAIEMNVATKSLNGRIVADSGYVGQLIMNLAINARDAMPDGGKLTIATGELSIGSDDAEAHPKLPDGDYLVLTVSDTGLGMNEQVKEHLFEPFFTTKTHGTGLGLATCRTIAQQSNAHIEVASEPGSGTTFNVYFPRVAGDLAAPSRPARSGSLPRGTETLLVVEDEPAVLEMVCTVLESLGYEVLQAVNGQEGLRVAREHTGNPIGLVLTDATMPVMSGKVMADWLRATYPGIKILFTSGYTDEIIALNNEFEPGMAFLAKPYSLAALAGRVRELLDGLS